MPEDLMGALNKNEIARIISERLGYSQRTSLILLERFLGLLKEGLARGEDIKMVKFGSFCPVEKKERKGVSPVNGEYITIPSKKTVVFRPSRTLKREINDRPREKVLQDRGGQQADRC
jgi:nucleoid DNA-binding protein